MTSRQDAVDRDIDALEQELHRAAPGTARTAVALELAAALLRKHLDTGAVVHLDAAIAHLESGLAAVPPEQPDRARHLAVLAAALHLRFQRTGDPADRDRAEAYRRQAGTAAPPVRGSTDPGTVPGGMPTDPAGEVAARYERSLAELEQLVAVSTDDVDRSAPPRPDTRRSRDFGGLPDIGARPVPPGSAVPPRPAAPPSAQPAYPAQSRPAAAPPAPAPAPAPAPPQGAAAPSPASPEPDAVAAPVPAAPPAPRTEAEPRAAADAPDRKPARAASPSDGRLEFAAAYREQIERERSFPFLFFVHRPHHWERVKQIIDRRALQLGGTPAVSQGAAVQDVRSGTTVTVVPTVLGATFTPERIEVVAGDDLRELTFQVTVPATTQPGRIDGYVDIFVGPLVIGQVPVAFEVREPEPVAVRPRPGEEELLRVANATIFDTIFISYSHKDADVVDLSVATYEGLGVRVLVDRHELRSGDAWRPRLEGLIHEANVFQLYWSSAAAASREVAHEWQLALGLAKQRDRFIRPLYWETPLPAMPEPLAHLHFSKLDLKALRRAAKAYLPREGLLRRALNALRPR